MYLRASELTLNSLNNNPHTLRTLLFSDSWILTFDTMQGRLLKPTDEGNVLLPFSGRRNYDQIDAYTTASLTFTFR